jgi:hypothetical protein
MNLKFDKLKFDKLKGRYIFEVAVVATILPQQPSPPRFTEAM